LYIFLEKKINFAGERALKIFSPSSVFASLIKKSYEDQNQRTAI